MINEEQLERTTLCKQFSSNTDETAFKSRNKCNFRTTTVYVVRPPEPLSFDRPWVLSTTDNDIILRHPLTSKPYFLKQPQNFDISNLHPTTLAVSHHSPDLPFDKLLVIPHRFGNNTLLGLYDGGHLRSCHSYCNEWVKVPRSGIQRFDDIAIYKDKVYALGRYGTLYLINIHSQRRTISIGKTLVNSSCSFGRTGWLKRVVVDENNVMYLVDRKSERMLQVYKLITQGNENSPSFRDVEGFDGNQVLFMTKDHYFFLGTSQKFPGTEYANCIVFTEGAFPRYGYGSFWEFSRFPEYMGFTSSDEDNFAAFRLVDQMFGKVGGNNAFPKIDWSPPGWIFDALSVSAAEFQSRLSTDSLEKSERSLKRELEEDKDKQNGEVQFDSNDSKSKDEELVVIESDSDSQDEELEAMESDSDSQDEELEAMESDSDSHGEEVGRMQCDINSQEIEDVEMHENANTEGDPSVQQDVCHVSPSVFEPESGTTNTQTPSVSPTEKETPPTLPSLNGGNNVTEEEALRKNITELAPRACTSSTSANHRSESVSTAEFEGFCIRADLVSLLEKIWLKHGNIIEQSIFRSGDIVARALESLATMVRILEENTAQSLSDTQVKYLVSTLSDLGCMHFKVDWLIASVEKAQILHKSKLLEESLENLLRLSSQAKERREILLEELSKLDEEENKRKKEIEKVSMMISFCEQDDFDKDKPLGLGLT